MPDTKTSRQHDHNQGNQSRSYTAEQKAAVDRVRKCKGTDYYAILDVKKEVTADGIKKAYRRLALVMHPDKNGAPGADEAFKLVSKAFQVLSDPQQKETFDRFGGDPAARGGGGGGEENPFSGFRSTGAGGAGGFARGPELSPEDLFNMFFGGGYPGPGPFGGGFVGGSGPFGGGFGGGGPFGEFVSFGGSGVRVQHFGGPGMRRRRPTPAAETEEAGRADQSQQGAGLRTTFIQLLPLIILFMFPIISGLFSELGSGSGKSQFPDVRFEKVHPFTQRRFTPKHNIPYWVSPRELKEFGMQPGAKGVDRKLEEMDKRAEVRYIGWLQAECGREMRVQKREIEDAMGWLWADAKKVKEASEKILPACQTLRDMGEGKVMG
ncbi:DnaJ-domain-containing protein [Terfezia boudieri ATCC MYA-4762]|uniref:DnaJ-domain-containing protein n=1 Tax=Terfezia boudieri ATCC MYA-4762 TaxID=1051890 RepID=A0A3N4M0S0_9PEZI|nr:DnaJ-domain-containing protein [Terfezia boudieri ATCC MYA-4762]